MRGGLIVGLLAVVGVASAWTAGAFARVEAEVGSVLWSTVPVRSAVPGESVRGVAVLEIDDAALGAFGRWSTWPRERLAGVIDLLNEVGVGEIALDITLEDPGDPRGDADLARAITDHGGVTLAHGARPPIQPLTRAAKGLGWVGLDTTSGAPILAVEGGLGLPPLGVDGIDDGGAIAWTIDSSSITPLAATPIDTPSDRSIFWLVREHEFRRLMLSAGSELIGRELSWPIPQAVLDEIDEAHAFAAMPWSEAPIDSMIALQRRKAEQGDQEAARAVPLLIAVRDWRDGRRALARPDERPAFWRMGSALPDPANGVVFIGWAASGSEADSVRTPLGSRTPGVYVFAQHRFGVDRGLRADRLDDSASAALVLFIGVFAVLGAALPRLTLAVVNASAGLVAAIALPVALHWSMAFAVPTVGVIAAVVVGAGPVLGLRSVGESRAREAIRRQFRARVAPELVERLTRGGGLSLEGARREVVVMFADLSGSTAVIASRAPEEAVSAINDRLRAIARISRERGGYVNKFLGDGVMVLWGAIEAQPDALTRATEAARRIVRELGGGRGVELGVRIGIAQGEAVVGDCGAPPELNDFTAVGRVVNLASRLCDEAGTDEHADVLIAVEAARAESAGLTPLGEIEPRGWGDAVRVWTV